MSFIDYMSKRDVTRINSRMNMVLTKLESGVESTRLYHGLSHSMLNFDGGIVALIKHSVSF